MTTFHEFRAQNGGMWCTVPVTADGIEGPCNSSAEHAIHEPPAVVLSPARPDRSPAERLHAAAEKWAQLDHAATWGPWSVHESWAGKCAVVTDGGHPIAIVSHGEPGPGALADAELIARSRPLAPVIAALLSAEADRLEVGAALIGWSISPRPAGLLALADAILGEASA